MFQNYDEILADIPPFRFIKEVLGIEYVQKEDNYFIMDPHTQLESILVTKNEYINTKPGSQFIAGNAVDLYVYFFSTSYKEALTDILGRYYDVLDKAKVYSLQMCVDGIAPLLEKQHDINAYLKNLSKNITSIDRFAQELSFIRNNHIDLQHVGDMLYVASADEITELMYLISDSEDIYDPEECNHIILPYWKSFGRVAYIDLVNVQKNNEVNTIEVNKAKLSYLGLPLMKQSPEVLHVYLDPWDAANIHTYNQGYSYFNQSCLAVKMDPQVLIGGIRFKDAVYRHTPGDSIHVMDAFREMCDTLSVADNQAYFESANQKTWESFVANKLLELIKDDNKKYFRTSAFIKSIKFVGELRRHCVEFLTEHGYADVINELDDSASGNTYPRGNLNIKVTDSGYVGIRKGQTQDFPISNFIVQIHYTVQFKANDEHYYHGALIMGSKRVPISFAARELQGNMTAIEAKARTLSNKLQWGDCPMIIESGSAKYVASVIKEQAAGVEFIQGCDNLGWNVDKQEFLTPRWAVDAFKTSVPKLVPYPGSNVFKQYRFKPFELSSAGTPVNDFINRDVVHIVSMVTAQLWRSYHGRRNIGVPIKNSNSQTRNLLHFLYHAFGQGQVIELNHNRRANETTLTPELCGMPAYGRTTSPDKLVGHCTEPLLILHNEQWGFEILEGLDSEEDLNGLLQFCENLFRGLVQIMLQGKSKDIEIELQDDDTLSFEHLIREGVDLINKLYDNELQGWVMDLEACSNIMVLLYKTKDWSDIMKLDFELNKVRLDYRTSRFTKQAMLESAKAIDPDAEFAEPCFINIDVDKMNEFVTRHSVRPMNLERVIKRKKTSEKVTDITEAASGS
jgi:hypothetical protein